MAALVSNPFATRFTQPGRIAPLDGTGRLVDVDGLIERLCSLGGTAAIVGPHGSGKSTLLLHLAAAIDRRGGRVSRVRLHSWRDAGEAWRAIRASPGRGTVCIDSWECIGLAARCVLRWAARTTGCGLLVTSHRDVGMPVLVRCGTNDRLLRSIVRSLPGHEWWHGSLISDTDIDAAFANQGGNLRESLYELYDRFEARARRVRVDQSDSPDERDGCTGAGHGIHEFVDGFSYAGAPERNLG